MPSALARLGWNERRQHAFAAHASGHAVPARVTLEHTHIYRVLSEAGESLARVSGRLRHHAATRADFPAVGDWVALVPADGAAMAADVRALAGVVPVHVMSCHVPGDVDVLRQYLGEGQTAALLG